jgi:hypothetical protein
MRIGNDYIGSSDLLTTQIGNFEVIPSPPSELNWTQGYKLYKFSFSNPNQSCHVKINGGNPIFLSVSQGFEMDESDDPIESFIIVEQGITYNFIGCY